MTTGAVRRVRRCARTLPQIIPRECANVGARPCLARGRSSRRRCWGHRGQASMPLSRGSVGLEISRCGRGMASPLRSLAGRSCRHRRSRTIGLRASGFHVIRRFRGSENLPAGGLRCLSQSVMPVPVGAELSAAGEAWPRACLWRHPKNQRHCHDHR